MNCGMMDESKSCARIVKPVPFFQRVDWMSFGLASLLSFAVYIFTLTPDADLEFSGIFATSAMHLGVSNPPAYPIWTLYTWLFVRLLPFSNIAWRVAVATAMASAFACGLIALMASRTGAMAVENFEGPNRLSVKEQNAIRMICGSVAGVGFGLDGCFWSRAVVPDQWNFNVFLFALLLCLLTQWLFEPSRKRYLYWAALVQGLILADSQALLPTALAVPFFVAIGNPQLGRNILFLIGIFFCAVLALNGRLHWFDSWLNDSTRPVEFAATILVVLVWLSLLVFTREFLSEWSPAFVCVALFWAGIAACLLLPIFSMTDPPVNWGYSRTVRGFFHVIGRGQYGGPDDVQNMKRLLAQWAVYGKIAAEQFGVFYLAAATVPLFLLHKILSLVRRWCLGLIVVWFLISLLMSIGLDISWDKSTYELNEKFLSPTHLVLAILAGNGMVLFATYYAARQSDKNGVVIPP